MQVRLADLDLIDILGFVPIFSATAEFEIRHFCRGDHDPARRVFGLRLFILRFGCLGPDLVRSITYPMKEQ